MPRSESIEKTTGQIARLYVLVINLAEHIKSIEYFYDDLPVGASGERFDILIERFDALTAGLIEKKERIAALKSDVDEFESKLKAAGLRKSASAGGNYEKKNNFSDD